MRQYIPIKEFARVILPTGAKEGTLAMLKAYFDDSGTHAGSNVVVMGGLIGSITQWNAFEQEWRDKLAHPLLGKPALRKWSTADCRARVGEFRDYDHHGAERDAVTRDFRKIIIDSELIGIASAIDQTAWDELVVGPARGVLGTALEACFTHCIAQTALIASTHPEAKDDIAIVFDQGIETERLNRITRAYKSQLLDRNLVSIAFADVGRILPLQAADMVATETYWYVHEWLNKRDQAQGRAHFQHYLANMRAQGMALGRAEIEADMKRRGPSGLLG